MTNRPDKGGHDEHNQNEALDAPRLELTNALGSAVQTHQEIRLVLMPSAREHLKHLIRLLDSPQLRITVNTTIEGTVIRIRAHPELVNKTNKEVQLALDECAQRLSLRTDITLLKLGGSPGEPPKTPRP